MGLIEDWLRLAAARVAEQRGWLTDLDAAIGDGDHGINMDRGMAAVVARLDADLGWRTTAAGPPGPFLVLVGRTITGTVGGASGALYGRAFTRAGERLVEPTPGPKEGAAALAVAVEAIAALGRSHIGEKTMLDALVPAVRAFAAAAKDGRGVAEVTARAADAADAGAAATVPLVATKGRASYLGERSRGHLDPGAASAALLLRALADVAATR